jgi:hypothetical protein
MKTELRKGGALSTPIALCAPPAAWASDWVGRLLQGGGTGLLPRSRLGRLA